MKYIFPPDEEIIDPNDIPLLRLEKISSKEYKADLIFPEYITKDAKEYLLHEDKFIYGVKARFETDDNIRLNDLGIGYIQIHQIASEEKTEKELNYDDDFIPICENCHGILHRSKNKTLEVSELKQIFRLREELRKTEKS